MSELKQRITQAMKDAMRAKDKVRLSTVRLILAELKRIEIDERTDVDDLRVLSTLDKMTKQRRDSIAQFEQAQRDDLAATERQELEVISTFLPAALTEDEIESLIQKTISDTGATSIADMGKVMAMIKPSAQGRADMGLLGKRIKAALS